MNVNKCKTIKHLSILVNCNSSSKYQLKVHNAIQYTSCTVINVFNILLRVRMRVTYELSLTALLG